MTPKKTRGSLTKSNCNRAGKGSGGRNQGKQVRFTGNSENRVLSQRMTRTRHYRPLGKNLQERMQPRRLAQV